MIQLTSLTDDELEQLDEALTLLDEAISMLERNGLVNDEDGVDMLELIDMVTDEQERRMLEDAEYKLERHVAEGLLERFTLENGEISYRFTEAGLAYLASLEGGEE